MYAIVDMIQLPLRTPADVGALIRDRRRVLKLDQADLARMIGVSRLWVNQVEKGKPGASLGLVLRPWTRWGCGRWWMWGRRMRLRPRRL